MLVNHGAVDQPSRADPLWQRQKDAHFLPISCLIRAQAHLRWVLLLNGSKTGTFLLNIGAQACGAGCAWGSSPARPGCMGGAPLRTVRCRRSCPRSLITWFGPEGLVGGSSGRPPAGMWGGTHYCSLGTQVLDS